MKDRLISSVITEIPLANITVSPPLSLQLNLAKISQDISGNSKIASRVTTEKIANSAKVNKIVLHEEVPSPPKIPHENVHHHVAVDTRVKESVLKPVFAEIRDKPRDVLDILASAPLEKYFFCFMLRLLDAPLWVLLNHNLPFHLSNLLYLFQHQLLKRKNL